jgi:enoyl-[acyl-carrier protein] reductase I
MTMDHNPLSGLLASKRGLIVGVANRNSIAWAIARRLAAAGMELAFTYQGEALKGRVEKTVAELGDDVPLFQLDVQNDEQIERVFADLGERWGKLDFLLHSVAYAPKETFTSPFVETTRDAYLTAHDVSAYSLVALTRGAAGLMTDGGSVVALSYHAAERVVLGYNLMGVAKASLEACVKYLAANLGERNIRVNAISAGALNTLAARGIPQFRTLMNHGTEMSPLGRPIEPEEVGDAGLFLASDLSTAITGEIMYVDAGVNIMAG